MVPVSIVRIVVAQVVILAQLDLINRVLVSLEQVALNVSRAVPPPLLAQLPSLRAIFPFVRLVNIRLLAPLGA